jgi:hypothetical protein
MLELAQDYGSQCTADSMETYTLQGDIATFHDPLLQMDLSYVVVSDTELQGAVNWLFGS